MNRQESNSTATAPRAPEPVKGHFLQPEWKGQGSLVERLQSVLPYVRADTVLDIGCASRYGKPDWLHGLLAKEVDHLVGIDINGKTIEALKAQGYDVHLADARDFDLHQQFDVVFAGELIEHLDNFHGFLTSVRRHLRPGGRLVLTTPNAFYVGNFIYRFGGHGRVHPEHTCWFCEDTLRQLLVRNGFDVTKLEFIGHASLTASRKAASFMFQQVLPPRLALDTMVAVATVEGPNEPG